MEKSEFVGWQVRLTTKSGSAIEGRVSEVNDIDCRLTLVQAEVFVGRKSRKVELVSVQGEDIVDLQVLNNDAEDTQEAEDELVIEDPAILRSSVKPQPTNQHSYTSAAKGGSKSAASGKNSWALDDVKELKRTEFDFEAGLQMFDKKRAFEGLKGTLRPEDLLVTHNQNRMTKSASATANSATLHSLAQLKPQTSIPKSSSFKQVPKEKIFYNNGEIRSKLKDSHKSQESQQQQHLPIRILQKPLKKEDQINDVEEKIKDLKIKELLDSDVNNYFSVIGSRASVPVVNEEIVCLIEQKASKLTGPTTDQQLESASREICRTLLSDELVAIPSAVLVLAGNHREGAVALAIGRSLVNRGISVTGLLAAASTAVNDHVSFQKRLFTSAGGKCLESVSNDLSSFDLIIDGAVGRDGLLDHSEFKRALDCVLLQGNGCFVASIERSLIPTKSDCVFALAFPKHFHRPKSSSSRLYLVDINLPAAAYKSSLSDFDPLAVFGNKMSVRLR